VLARVGETTRHADAVAAQLPADAAEAVVVGELAPLQGARETVTNWSKDVLKDVTCDLATDQLFPDEKDEYAGKERDVPDIVQPTLLAIGNKIDEEVAREYGTDAVKRVKWQAYAVSILQNADRYTKSLNQEIKDSDGSHTRAYYF
jgi:hypothetical protein